MSDDQSRIYNSLRASTIALLGYGDVDTLSAAQEIRVSRAISLRLIVDASQAKQLRGETIDVRAFTDASESLERMVGGNPDASTAHDFSGAREELRQFFARRADAIRKRDERLAEAKAASSLVLDASNTDASKPAGGDAQYDHAVAHPALIDPAAAAGGGWPTEPTSSPQSAPQPALSDVEKMDRANAVPVPQHYLKQPDEPWRKFVNSDGIISPWFRPSG
jgi:hypothetical protein